MIEQQQYKIKLENYYGPLDLLLHLIRENEIDIYNIPIAAVARQYIGFLEVMKKLDINLASEFLVMASSLLDIKAKMLLPTPEEGEEEEEADPRLELVKKLLEYKHFKELARRLAALADVQAKRYARPPAPCAEPPRMAEVAGEIEPLEEELSAVQAEASRSEERLPTLAVSAWDIFRAFERISRATSVDIDSTSILYSDVPLKEIMENLLQILRAKGIVKLSAAVRDAQDKIDVVGHFLASLELARQKKIAIQQEEDFSDINLRLRPEAGGTDSARQNAPQDATMAGQ
jgi:segregation and condensation protein A